MEAVRLDDSVSRRADFGGRLGHVLFNDFWGGGRKVSLEPSAFLVTLQDRGSRIDSHFHDVDQFQVSTRGGGRIGAHAMNPVTVHYADAYAPYGPIVAAEEGLSFFTLRMMSAGGTWGMPGGRDAMPAQRPAKARRNLVVPLLPPAGALQPEEVRTEDLMPPQADELAVTVIRLGPGAIGSGSATAGGQYLMVCQGCLMLEGRTLPAESLVLLRRGESLPELTAGQEGATLLALRFPAPSERPGSNPAAFRERIDAYVNGFSYTEVGSGERPETVPPAMNQERTR